MDLQGLPRPSRRTSPALLALQFVHALLVSVVCWGLAMTGAFFVAGGGSLIQGAGVIALLVLVLGAEVGLAVHLISRRRKINALIQSARRALAEQRPNDARHSLAGLFRYVEYRANPAQVLFGLGVADLLDGEIDRAQLLLRRAGNYPAALELRAIIMLNQGMISHASKLMATVVAMRPQRMESWVTLAACEQAAGREDGALQLLEAAIKKWPSSFQIRRALDGLKRGDSLMESVLERGMPRKPALRADAV